jgi:outer membrane protein insertion porin family
MADTFTISDIRLQGLQRVSAGTVFNLLPVNVGDAIDEVAIRQLIRTLFQSGYFSDVRMARDEDVLVITFSERPAIESIEISGNKAIKTDALLEGLGQQGLKEGEIFKQATLERVGIELERQYVAQGRYGASIETNVEELQDRHRRGKELGHPPHQRGRRRGLRRRGAAGAAGAQAP